MIIISNNDALINWIIEHVKKAPISWLGFWNRVKYVMHQINPKKFKEIKNKTIPNPLRPKFRQKAQSNIYFLSQRKVNSEKKLKLIKNIRFLSILTILLLGGYFLTN